MVMACDGGPQQQQHEEEEEEELLYTSRNSSDARRESIDPSRFSCSFVRSFVQSVVPKSKREVDNMDVTMVYFIYIKKKERRGGEGMVFERLILLFTLKRMTQCKIVKKHLKTKKKKTAGFFKHFSLISFLAKGVFRILICFVCLHDDESYITI